MKLLPPTSPLIDWVTFQSVESEGLDSSVMFRELSGLNNSDVTFLTEPFYHQILISSVSCKP